MIANLIGTLENIKTRSIIPVDLNAIMCGNAILLADFYEMLNNRNKAQFYRNIAKKWRKAVTDVLWHEDIGAWLDYDISNSMVRDYFYPSNIAPLWTGCYDEKEKKKIARLVLKYLNNEEVLLLGGIPTSVEHSGEQWDYPNSWPPLQHIMIVGLNNTNDESAQRYAFELAQKWVRSNYKGYLETEAMFEKVRKVTSIWIG